MRPALGLALLALGLALPLAAAAPSELKDIRRRIGSTKKQLATEQRAEKSQLSRLEQLNRQVDASRRDLRTHESNLRVVEQNIAELQRRSLEYQRLIALNRSLLSRQLRIIHKSGPLGDLGLLLSAKEPAELISRYRFLKTLARQNAAGVKETREALAKAGEIVRENMARQLELTNNKQAAVAARAKAEDEKRKRAVMLAGIRAKKGRTEQLLKELGQSAQNLEAKMLELQRAAAEAAAAARAAEQQGTRHTASTEIDHGPSRLGRRHSLPWPLRGPLLSRFGEHMHPKFRTKVFNRGVEIGGAVGSPVRAVADGTARFADYFEGYGQMVILDHGGGAFTVYGHNSQLQVSKDQEVKRGEVIAEVGDSSTSGKPCLYFEIRQLARAVDPLLWLAR